MFTLLVNITCFNLLISILSNTFDNVQTTLDATHCRTKVEILNELSVLMAWNRGKNELDYLHFVYYSSDKLSVSDNGGQNEWTGRVRIILDKLDDLKHNQNRQKKELISHAHSAH